MSCFITFEGPDGSGKTTQVQALYRHLVRAGYPVLLVREPGGTDIGDQIRTILHDTRNVSMQPRAEVLLYSASRAQLVGQVIVPALRDGKIVLCDRYAEATLAYQGYGHGLDLSQLRAILAFATSGLRPDLIIYLDIDVEEGLRRKQKSFQAGQGEWNRMDQLPLEFHRRVRAGYLEMAATEPERWFVVDATRSIASIQSAIRRRVQRLLRPRVLTRPQGGSDLASAGKEASAR